MSHLKARATRGKDVSRLRWKIYLVRQLYEGGWHRQDVLELLRFIDWVLKLPAALAQRFNVEVNKLETEKDMRYVTSFERMGHERGLAKGLEQGRSQGFLQGEASLLKRQLSAPALIVALFMTSACKEEYEARELCPDLGISGEAKGIDKLGLGYEDAYGKLVNYVTLAPVVFSSDPERMAFDIEPDNPCRVQLSVKKGNVSYVTKLSFGDLDPTSLSSYSHRQYYQMPGSLACDNSLTARTTDAKQSIHVVRATDKPEGSVPGSYAPRSLAQEEDYAREAQALAINLFSSGDAKRVHRLLAYLIKKCGGKPSELDY